MLPFLPSQKLYILKPRVDPHAAVHPEQFHAERQRNGERRDEEPAPPDAKLWEELPREDLLAGSFKRQALHRVALTTDAGLGKTYNLAWLRHELNDRPRRLRAFTLAIGDLTSPADLIERLLVPQVRNVPGNHHEDPTRLQADLERLQRRGQLALLLDGLDMASDASVQALAALLDPNGEWGRCRIVVAGRPFALERHWTTLFDGKSWQFVQIAEFDSKQQRVALGKLEDNRDRYDLIPREARDILRSPRVLEYLHQLGAEQLEGIKTVADVYWQACGYMLRQALRRRVDVLTQQRFLALLGALAFTMYAKTERQVENAPLRPNLDRVNALDMPDFLTDVWRRFARRSQEARQEADGNPDRSRREFLKDLRKLSRLNALLNHGWLDVNTVGGVGEDLLWRNASLQEFFAAYWVSRWGKEPDTQRLRDWVVDPLTRSNRGFYWFWRYASEMPDDAILPSSTDPPKFWFDAMAPLYDGSVVDAEGHPIRSTEFIYRSWSRMERWRAAPLRKFFMGFPEIRCGEKGPAQKEIAKRLLDGFTLLATGKRGDTDNFTMGAPADEDPSWDSVGGKQNNPQHPVSLSPYGLHRFCVTNVEYELFDPRHRKHRWWEGSQHPAVKESGDQMADDDCPVVMVSWYDACVFAWWTGSYLPTEAQWEYACRGGASSYQVFHFGNSLSSRQANFNGNYPFGGAKKGDYLERTTKVKSYQPNAFGLYNMHGNVWEWCMDWYAARFYESAKGRQKDPLNDEPASARVLRGGSWGYYGGDCRSAYRDRDVPGLRYHFYGFRLAAVPCVVGAKPSKQG